ncbi:MAG TPA: hypothetical protein P5267_01360 [Patescibacteria group bacterium]|nr:hypothetical protein [Patescibacteria group bacterium]
MDYPLSADEIYVSHEPEQQIPIFVTLNQSRRLLRLFLLSSVLIFVMSIGLVLAR